MESFKPYLREDRKSQSVFQKKLAQRGSRRNWHVRSHGHKGSEPGRRPRSDPFPISPYHGASRIPKSLKPAVPSALHLPRISIPPPDFHTEENTSVLYHKLGSPTNTSSPRNNAEGTGVMSLSEDQFGTFSGCSSWVSISLRP